MLYNDDMILVCNYSCELCLGRLEYALSCVEYYACDNGDIIYVMMNCVWFVL